MPSWCPLVACLRPLAPIQVLAGTWKQTCEPQCSPLEVVNRSGRTSSQASGLSLNLERTCDLDPLQEPSVWGLLD